MRDRINGLGSHVDEVNLSVYRRVQVHLGDITGVSPQPRLRLPIEEIRRPFYLENRQGYSQFEHACILKRTDSLGEFFPYMTVSGGLSLVRP